MISIGPFHHGKEHLKAMEEHKKGYLTYFLQQLRYAWQVSLHLLRKGNAKLRNSYAETIPLNCNELAKMVLVDAVFLIELFLRYFEPYLRTDDDRIIGKSNLVLEIRTTLCCLENRPSTIPFSMTSMTC
ncbi:hypothetical protein CUMW_123180 [Citrus unshiu]|uniref:Uncharacterized protein n=1 Tax=Citrus unshiu TaxID=55188 RepID=A0A2H5PC97_CITUN|nr:hypothetical protein CUMW_123180 [Citrus unshiu]